MQLALVLLVLSFHSNPYFFHLLSSFTGSLLHILYCSFYMLRKKATIYFSIINFSSYSNILKSVYCFYSHGECCLSLFWTIYQFFLQNLRLLPVHLQTIPFLTASSHLLLDVSSALPTDLMLLSSRRNVLFYTIFYNSLF